MSRREIEIIEGDPQVEQVMVVVRTLTAMFGTSFLAALAVSATFAAGTILGWIAVGAAALLGSYPAVAHARRSRRPGRLTLGVLPSHAAEVVAQAGRQAGRLRALAVASPPGPVADHFRELATTADRYVVALHATLGQAAAAGQDRELDEDVARVVAQLTELTEAADELRQAQRRYLEASPLTELTEATRRLAKVISASQGLDPKIP